MLADLRALIPTPRRRARARKPPLPIADYDDLNAGQVTARLSDLSQPDLKTVLDYERRHRNRRSVIERAEQLQATPPWPGYDDRRHRRPSSAASHPSTPTRSATTRAATAAAWRSSRPRSSS